MRGLLADRIAWEWQSLERPGRSLTAISYALCAAFAGLFLCVLASVFGTGPDGGWLALPPDYTAVGWTARLVGAALGIGSMCFLVVLQRRYLVRRRSRSHPVKLLRLGLIVAAVGIAWEIAILASVLIVVAVIIYMMFGEDGI